MEIYNDVGAANSVFGWGIFMILYFGFILFSAGVGLYVLFLLIKFLKVGTRAFNKYLEDDK